MLNVMRAKFCGFGCVAFGVPSLQKRSRALSDHEAEQPIDDRHEHECGQHLGEHQT